MKNSNYTGLGVLILGVVAIVLSYVFGFTAYNEKNSELTSEIDDLQSRCDTLKADYANIDTYKKDIEQNNKDFEDMLKKFDTSLTNEGQIMDIYNMDKKCSVLTSTATFVDPTETYAFDGSLTTPEMTAPTTDDNGNIIEAEPIITSTAINNSYRGVSANVSASFTGTYDNMKKAIESIVTDSKRRVLTNLAFTADSTTDEITCTYTLSEYALTGDDRKVKEVEIPDSAVGRTDIFTGGLGVQVTTE